MLDRCRIACWLAVPVFILRAWESAWTTVDDAWISARFAANLAAGNGLVYSIDEPAIEGYTNLLWTLWLALGIAIGADETTWMVGSGLFFGGLCIPLLGEVVRKILPHDVPGRRWPAALVSWIAALDVHHAIASTNGLETSMYVFALLAAVWGASLGKRPWLTGLALASLAAVRPEGLLAGGMLTLIGRWSLRDWAKTVVTLGGGWTLLEAWRWLTYGALLPNTFAAKAEHDLFFHFYRNMEYLSWSAQWWVMAGLALVLGPLIARTRSTGALMVIGLGSAMAAVRVYMWMPGGRLLVPVAFLALAILGAAAHRWPAKLLLGLWVAVAVSFPFMKGESKARRYDRVHSVSMPNNASRVATHLRQHLPAGSWLATRDAGVMAYFFGTDNKIAELHNRALTLPHPDNKNTDVFAHTPKNPAVIVLTGADPKSKRIRYGGDRRIFARADVAYTYLGRIHQHYRRYYDVYVRTDLDVPPLPKDWVTNRNGPKKTLKP